MGGFFWLRPAVLETADYVVTGYEAYPVSDRIPCDDVTVERPALVSENLAFVDGHVRVVRTHAAFPARALGASWTIAALVEPE